MCGPAAHKKSDELTIRKAAAEQWGNSKGITPPFAPDCEFSIPLERQRLKTHRLALPRWRSLDKFLKPPLETEAQQPSPRRQGQEQPRAPERRQAGMPLDGSQQDHLMETGTGRAYFTVFGATLLILLLILIVSFSMKPGLGLRGRGWAGFQGRGIGQQAFQGQTGKGKKQRGQTQIERAFLAAKAGADTLASGKAVNRVREVSQCGHGVAGDELAAAFLGR